jgi:GNAT superfamily N-acetyltransferase
MTLIDLRGNTASSDLLNQFIALYDRTFTVLSEREDPSQWRSRLIEELEPPEPRTHLLVSVPTHADPGGDCVSGGLVFEYYRRSRCGLLTYIVVDPARRRQGIGGRLISRSIEILAEDASCEGQQLRAVFAELDDPAKVIPSQSAMPPAERAQAFAKIARRVAVPYVQPELIGGSGRERRLMLAVILRPEQNPLSIAADVVLEFLREFYQALGVKEPDRDIDFQTVIASCGPEISLRSLI